MSKPTLKKLQQAMSELDTLVSDPLSTNEQIDAAKAAVEELFSRLGVLLEDARREFAELMAQRANDTSSTFLARPARVRGASLCSGRAHRGIPRRVSTYPRTHPHWVRGGFSFSGILDI
jgi:hypothetical protein